MDGSHKCNLLIQNLYSEMEILSIEEHVRDKKNG